MFNEKITYYPETFYLYDFSETIVGGYPEILTETHGLIQGAFVAGFLVGAVAQTKETNEAFKRNTQLTVYVDKKMATVIFKPHLFLIKCFIN